MLVRCVLLYERDHIGIDLSQTPKMLARSRYERFVRLPVGGTVGIMKRRKIPKDRRGRRRCRRAFFAKAPQERAPLTTRHPVRFHPMHQLGKARIALQNREVVHAVAAGKIEQDQRHEHLGIAPALGAPPHAHMPIDRRLQAAD